MTGPGAAARHGWRGRVRRIAQELRQASPRDRVQRVGRYAWNAWVACLLRILQALLFNRPMLWVWVRLLEGRVEFFGTSHTIGDLCNIDYYLKRKLHLGSRVTSIFLANKPFIANPYLARFLATALGSRRVLFVMSRFLCCLLEPIEWQLFFAWDLAPQSKRRRGLHVREKEQVSFTQHPSEWHDLNRRYQFHLERELPVAERRRARAAMEQLGLPREAPFVCIHAREGGFKAAVQPGGHNTYRDIDIATYLPAIARLVDEGFWVVRMGEATVKGLPAMPRVIDYARTHLKSDWLDVVLVAECEFLLGCNSGFSQLAHLFNKRSLWTNSIPIEVCPCNELALWIPRLIFSTREGRYLTFPEIVERGIGQFHRTQRYLDAQLEVHANTPQDILDATQELLAWHRGVPGAEEDRRAQEAFNRLFPPHYKAFGTRSRLAASFLRTHQELMPQETSDEPIPSSVR